MRRKFHAKCLFRALGRMVMANTYWLIEGVDQYEGVEDVKRRVQQAVRGKAKKKQLLTITVNTYNLSIFNLFKQVRLPTICKTALVGPKSTYTTGRYILTYIKCRYLLHYKTED